MASKYFCDICGKEIKSILDCKHDNITHNLFCGECLSEFIEKINNIINDMKSKKFNSEPKPEESKKKSFFSFK